MIATQGRRIGYVGVDILNNATICNEASGLLAAGVPLEVVTVYRHERPTYYQDHHLNALQERVTHLFPLSPLEAAKVVIASPFVFGRGFAQFEAINPVVKAPSLADAQCRRAALADELPAPSR